MWPTTWPRSTLLATGLLLLASPIAGVKHALGRPERHDSNWQPEYVLVATAQNITINCESRYSVTFNQTSPGPALRLQEGKTTWVRVWNRIPDNNVTVVSLGISSSSCSFSCAITSD